MEVWKICMQDSWGLNFSMMMLFVYLHYLYVLINYVFLIDIIIHVCQTSVV